MSTETEKRTASVLPIDADAAETLARSDEALARIRSALRGLRYGTVTAVVQDGVVVQVERTEKVRLDKKDRAR